ncbi:class I SAM-dependent methyltransferase [Kitasatospora sp. DSM 101779]|uniref:class I SAM-dependent methyltransferase n=1 Tax=Kitasatospora sp. DSM 101779 TaxID=2853165 RepID=UPI0021D84132|nr:class I SAM-dependent methyltransferase [Kitasatospora sp. DSM 101779]MCU7820543.1 methyltransferase domain-containing protein [Kitasatospora sp. DSM 101779]
MDEIKDIDGPAGVAAGFDREAWEERYRTRSALWSGRPNPQLVAEAAVLAPGRALDAGCGEGADALWLAGRGWRVTAADLAATALDRAAARAAAADPQLADRITWLRADLGERPPAGAGFELVSAQYLHLPVEARPALFAGLAAAVAPGGTLLIVGHHPRDLAGGGGPRLLPEMLFTPEEAAAGLDPADWQVRTARTRPRRAEDRTGRPVTVHDAVLVAVRRGSAVASPSDALSDSASGSASGSLSGKDAAR